MHGQGVESVEYAIDDYVDGTSWAARMDTRGWVTLAAASVFAAGVLSVVGLALSHSM